jgi:hypothetical protein
MPRKVTHPEVPLGDGDELGLASGAGVDRTAERVLLADGDAAAAVDEMGVPLPSGFPLLCPFGLVLALGRCRTIGDAMTVRRSSAGIRTISNVIR